MLKAIKGLSIAAIMLTATTAMAKPTCVDASGEGAIVNNDVPSAKVEAVNRAKWSAVEQVAGVDVKSKAIVVDSALLDDIITTRTRGVVTGYTVLSETNHGDSVKVRVNACVERADAQTAVSALALNAAVSVYLTARKLDKPGKAEYDDENILAQKVIGKLAENGFTVRDIAESHALKLSDMEAALKGGNQTVLRNLVYRYLTNSVLIGRIEPTRSMNKGDDAGYGIKMPFHTVTARLSYRLMTRDAAGRMTVLAAGAEEARGLAPDDQDAYAEAQKNLAERFVPLILEKINARMDQIAARILVTVDGVKEPSETFAIRDVLQKVTWVTNVEETGLGRFRVSFPENPLYLANGLSQKGFRIIRYSQEEIRVKKP